MRLGTMEILLIVVLALHSMLLPGAAEGVKFYLVPNFKAMAEQGYGYEEILHFYYTDVDLY